MLDSLRGSVMPVGRAFGRGSAFGRWPRARSPALESSIGRFGGSRLGGLGPRLEIAAYPCCFRTLGISVSLGKGTTGFGIYDRTGSRRVEPLGGSTLGELDDSLHRRGEPSLNWLCLDILPRGDRVGSLVGGTPEECLIPDVKICPALIYSC